MNGQTKHWVTMLIGLGTILGTEIGKITNWSDALTPPFVSALLIQGMALAAVVYSTYYIQPKPPSNTVTLKGRS